MPSLRSDASRLVAAALTIVGVATVVAGCGASAGTITVGVPAGLAPAVRVPQVESATDVAVGPGAVIATIRRRGYAVSLHASPNRASVPNRIAVSVTRAGAPVHGATVRLTVNMETMDMGIVSYALRGDGVYAARVPAWVMPGRWQLVVSVASPGGPAVRVGFDDLLRA